MADYAVHRLRHNGRIIEPGERIEGLTTQEWKRLHALKAIRSEMHPVEVVEAEALELEQGMSESGVSKPDDAAADFEEDALEEEVPPIELDASASIVEPEQAKQGRRKRGGGQA